MAKAVLKKTEFYINEEFFIPLSVEMIREK